MENEMVERIVAKIAKLFEDRAEETGNYISQHDGRLRYEGEIPVEEIARAVIEAMREPNADMVDAGRDVGPDAPYGASETAERWQAMIDAALATPPAKQNTLAA